MKNANLLTGCFVGTYSHSPRFSQRQPNFFSFDWERRYGVPGGTSSASRWPRKWMDAETKVFESVGFGASTCFTRFTAAAWGRATATRIVDVSCEMQESLARR